MEKEKNYITPRGFARLQEELHQLARVERPEVTKTVAWAASNGDRSENADYIYGKKRLREIDRRTRFLTSRIDKAIVVDPILTKSNKVQFGATVTIEDEDDGETKTISIVGVDEINTEKNQISWRSPLGSSLIGKEVGDTILLRIPIGTKTYEIMEIVYVNIE
ncbi:transcription elongation factor GreB [Bacteriovorax sp. PP10]|uniref:Transcription elongation factor GreB n=1 Tax=Bacteriovorax antarcticus TaxID=3088717 RepID=A0ABU5VR50_9BACT|nr:transcription elongation factor GreB [Bacteriovorax sp. PP10]MEA9355518.1 transcription elongation factor GreB [Bacteriovorax sp. PP10]